MYDKILIATDGSQTAAKAAAQGAEIAKAIGSSVVLLYVGEQAAGTEILERVKGELGVDAQTVVVAGDPDEQIMEVAEREDAGLIVVGNKGMTGAKRFLLGSVPNQISHHSTRDVLIVKTT